MGVINKPNTFSANTTISASQVNANFDTVYNEVNGALSAANLASSSVTTAKIADSNVTTAKINDSAVTTAKINDGAVTSEKLAATIACRAYRNAAVNLTASAAKIVLDAEEFDVGSDWDITNGRFTAPVTGYYQVNANLAADNLNTAGDQIIMYVYVNGAEHAIAKSYIGAAGNDPSVSISTLCSVTSGQYIEMYGFCTTTEAVTTGPSRTFMSVHFVGA